MISDKISTYITKMIVILICTIAFRVSSKPLIVSDINNKLSTSIILQLSQQ